MKQPIGIQLFSVRDVTPTDLEGALRALSAMGYSSVEFAGFFGHTAREVARMLRENGLTASGTHTPLPVIEQDVQGIIEYHKAIGCNHIIIPGHDLSTKDKITDFVKRVEVVAPVLAAAGLTLGYHNHSHEFIRDAEGACIYDAIEGCAALSLELDTYWAFNAGVDPIAKMRAIKDRLCFIHIKDGLAGGEGKPLGQGEAPVRAVYQEALNLNVPMVVESETLTPDGLSEARACIEFIKSLQ